ncbi:hypothetical protein IGS68_33585 (plasmid) [Skermanella sp. TT6]|uniref:Minor tail protein n=1 Tax=Skermanella cutis TaxID=2775420 RepID=A0ABX7BGN9_9PROT|nr:hypothetical protein [Skermanella sp. TT6]QQP93555.1 hypothetical protein IGS68_33585 [Skermanella sp. TT6]
MPITTMDDFIAGLTGSPQEIPIYYGSSTTAVGGYANLNNTFGGNLYNQSLTPSTPLIPTDATRGYPPLTAPAAGQSLYLARWGFASSVIQSCALYDRVYQVGGFSGTSTATQNIAQTATLPATRAPDSGLGLEIWLESYDATGATASNVTVTYTNSDGITGRTATAAMIANFPIGRMLRIPLQDGDSGVASVQSVRLSASTGAAGNFGLALLRRKAVVHISSANTGIVQDFVALGMPVIDPDAALQFVQLSGSTGTGPTWGSLTLISA